MIVRDKAPELVRILEKIFTERCNVPVVVKTSYRPVEKKNTEPEIIYMKPQAAGESGTAGGSGAAAGAAGANEAYMEPSGAEPASGGVDLPFDEVRAVNDIVRRLHPDENLACHQADDHGHDHGKTGGDPSGISDETAHVLVILCAEPLCNRNGKPGADADDETVNHKVDGGGGTDRSQCIDTEKFSNNDRIDHAVKLLEQKSHQHRNRKAQNQLRRAPVCHIFYGRALRRAAHGKTILSKKRL